MNILLISCSLSPTSRSRILAIEAAGAFKSRDANVTILDLRDFPLPMCDGEDTSDPNVVKLADAIRAADAVILAVPIYNYDANGAAKNMVEHVGSAWEGKTVGFLCAAGGHSSYMSIMSLANSLMLDFRCVIVPRFVYAVGGDFTGDTVSSPKIKDRIAQLADESLKLAGALRSSR